MSDNLTREQQIIKAFIAGKPVAPAQTGTIMGRTRTNPSAEETPGRFGFGLSPETMEKLEKRKAGEAVAKQRREWQDDRPVDREALRRDILGSDRLRKVKAATQYQSNSKVPYVRKSSEPMVPRHALGK